MYGIIFAGKEEASYSNFRLWESTGSVITYSYSPYLCTHIKLYLLLGLLILGILGYSLVLIVKSRRDQNELDITKEREFYLVKNRLKNDEVAD